MIGPEDGEDFTVRTRPTPGQDFGALLDAFAELAAAEGAAPDVPLVIAAAGPIDPESGEIITANIPCLMGKRPAEALARHLGRPVHFVNDADAFALAEAISGAGRGHRIVLGAIIGTGVGGGLVVEERLVRGLQGIGGEWGHGPVAPTRVKVSPIEIPRMPCGCGQVGCADSFGSARGIERLHALLGGGETDSRAIVAAWRQGDAVAVRTIAVWAEMLSGPLAMAINLTGASVVPVGGGIGTAVDLVETLDREVRSRILLRSKQPVVVPARFGAKAGLIGAALLGARLSQETTRPADRP